jgi:NAD(P)H dehydrogenase (quinone)
VNGASGEPNRGRAATLNQLLAADAIIVGSPGYFGSMASAVKHLFEECVTSATPPATDRSRPWRQYLFHNKIGAAFTATGTTHGGNEQTLHSILTMLMHLGMIVVTPGQQQPILENDAAPYGPTAITGPEGDLPLTDEAAEAARNFGRDVARVTTWVRVGQAEWHARPVTQQKWLGEGTA